MTTLTSFLLARIGEDEEVARNAGLGPHFADTYYTDEDRNSAETWSVSHRKSAREVRKGRHDARAANAAMYEADHIARHDPARVLLECEAKRRIVERAVVLFGASGLLDGAADRAYEYDDNVLPLLALPYADHPEFQEEWRP